MGKGTRREQQACEIYEEAGYETYRPATVQFGENDVFGLFDLIAVHPNRKPHYTQVKSNRASGIIEWMQEARDLLPREHAEIRFLVCHDRQGWRMARPTPEGYEWLYDGRDSGASMGDPLAEVLRE
jgi:hypothetical protein